MAGQIRKRGKSYSVMVDMPPDPVTGKRRQKRITAKDKNELDVQVAKFIVSVSEGGFAEADATKILVSEYLERWLDSISQTLRHRSFRRYSEIVRLHVTPKLGKVRLAKLSPLDIQRLYADRLAANLSPSTVNNIHVVLHRALKQAVRWNLLVRNPADSVDPPHKAGPTCNTWNQKQVSTFLAQSDQDEWAALWRLALFTGMRQGEILALHWADVDLTRRVLSVRSTLSRAVDGSLVFGEPKTSAGRRSIALPASVVQSLQKHRIQQAALRLRLGSVYHDTDMVFATIEGIPIHPNTLSNKFHRLIERAGLPRIRFHDMRHTCATLMLANGEHPKIVQERLGHANISMTLDRYSHVTMDMQREAAERLDQLMGGT